MGKPYGRSERLADARPSIGRPCKKGGRMRLTAGMALVLIVVAGLLGSGATVPASREDKAALVAAATSRLQQMSTADPALRVLIQQGYSLAPSSLSVLARVAVSRVTTPRTSHGAAEGRDARRPKIGRAHV